MVQDAVQNLDRLLITYQPMNNDVIEIYLGILRSFASKDIIDRYTDLYYQIRQEVN